MIQTFRARGYGCLTDVTASLTPLHAFIGPNDSGKSTLLHGLRTVVQLASGRFEHKDGVWSPFDPYLSTPTPIVEKTSLSVGVQGGAYSFEVPSNGQSVERVDRDPSFQKEHRRVVTIRTFVDIDNDPLRQLRGVRLLRLDPDALRAPSGLVPETSPVGFLDDRGHGLAGVYFAIRNRNDDAFAAIVDHVRRQFPTIKNLRVKAVTSSEVALEAELSNGARVMAARMSEGLLYYLAFTALRYLDPVSLILVEEPENGLHPARIADVIKVLRAVVQESSAQVVMATHSPLVVNELEPDEVTLVTRPSMDQGTVLTPLRQTHNFQKRSSVYALGELWLSYADGVDEAPLTTGRDPS